ncbi:hypothetical protein ACX4MT_13065 [Roseomonas mucosa]
MERQTPKVRLLDSHIAREPDGGVVFIGMSVEAARLAFSHASAWFWFRQSRRIGSFDGMLTAELRTQAVRELLVARLRQEGFGEDEIDALLDRHRRDDAGDPEEGEEGGYRIALGTRHPSLKFRARPRQRVPGQAISLRITS